MSDQEKSPWEKALDEISSPWDWVAAALGAAGGAGFTYATHGADLGSSIATGALIGIAVRKAIYASLRRKRLKRRALGLREELEESRRRYQQSLPETPNVAMVRMGGNEESLIEQLDREFRLWTRRAISDEEFSKQLDDLVDNYRKTS